MDGTLVATIVGIAITTLGIATAGLWAYNEAVKRQFEGMDKKFTESFQTMFRRLDENKKGYYEDFVLKEVLRESNEARKEIVDEKIESLKSILVQKIDSLSDKVTILTARTKDHVQ